MTAPGVASTHPPDRQPPTPGSAVYLDGFGGVGGAGGDEPTRRWAPHPQGLIKAHQGAQKPSRYGHRSARFSRSSRAAIRRTMSFLSSPGPRPTSSGPTEISSEPLGSSGVMSTKIARNCRRSRLRTTAFPTRRGIANATRVIDASELGSGRKLQARGPRRTLTPPARRAWKAERPRIGPIRPTASPDPWPGGCAEWPGRTGWTYGRESRGSWLAYARWAGRFSSRLTSSSSQTDTSGAGTTKHLMGRRFHERGGARNVHQRYALEQSPGNRA